MSATIKTQLQIANEYEFEKLVHKMDRITDELRVIGENDIGLLDHSTASRFHDLVTRLGWLASELKEDSLWTGEKPEEIVL